MVSKLNDSDATQKEREGLQVLTGVNKQWKTSIQEADRVRTSADEFV